MPALGAVGLVFGALDFTVWGFNLGVYAAIAFILFGAVVGGLSVSRHLGESFC